MLIQESNIENGFPQEIMDYFDSKNVRTFKETTPKRNIISGKILLNHGSYHGSLLITRVNGEDTLQFIRGFPKIHYYDEDEDDEPGELSGYEKLDGTCVGLYLLRDHNGKVIELVPKSRQRAVLDEHFQEMLSYCDTRQIRYGHESTEYDVVYVELYGMLNEHILPHKKTYIDIRLIGAVEGDGVTLLDPFALRKLSEEICVPLPERLVDITLTSPVWSRNISTEEHELYYHVRINDPLFGNASRKFKYFSEVVGFIQDYLDSCNNTYMGEKGYLKYEGVVLQTPKINNKTASIETKYIKIKSSNFMEKMGTSKLTIPVNEIRKEIQKIINENLTTYMEDYDEREAIHGINEYLLEDYTEQDVKHPQTQKIIIKELHKYIDSIQDESVNQIVDKLLQENTQQTAKDLMRTFATEYPMMKHKSRDVYFVLSKRLEKLSKQK